MLYKCQDRLCSIFKTATEHRYVPHSIVRDVYLVSRISGSGESETTGWWMDTPCRLPTSGGVCLPALMQFMKTVTGILSSLKVRKVRFCVMLSAVMFSWNIPCLFLLIICKLHCKLLAKWRVNDLCFLILAPSFDLLLHFRVTDYIFLHIQ